MVEHLSKHYKLIWTDHFLTTSYTLCDHVYDGNSGSFKKMDSTRYTYINNFRLLNIMPQEIHLTNLI